MSEISGEAHPASEHAAIKLHLEAHTTVVNGLFSPSILVSVEAAVNAMIATYGAGGKAIFFGNGGSAADAMHLAAEMLGRFLRERRPLAALALADNHSAVTAIGNDYGYSRTFARQVEALADSRDIALGLSTSGRSENVETALIAASERGARTIALTGDDPGPVGAAAEIVVAVPSAATPRIQEAHILIGHILCDRVERSLLP